MRVDLCSSLLCAGHGAPRGQTPILDQWSRHDRLSDISAITLAPHRCYFFIQRRNICAEDVVAFLRQLRRSIRRKMVLIMDRWNVHRAKTLWKYLEAHSDAIRVEWLPAYAPDLNPVEQVWNHSKYSDLANVAPDDLEELDQLVRSSISDTRSQRHLLRSFFQTAGLVL
ncbi:MAG: transposase [bacterium]